MKPKWTGWKEGVLTEDLLSYGGSQNGKKAEHKKGDTVRYRRYKFFDSETGIWTGKYEWYYLNLENHNLVRTKKLLIKNK